MPKLPVLSGPDIIARLERLVFVQIRQRGSHVVLRRENVGTVVPVHREVKAGTLAAILRQSGVSIEQFLAAQ